jgi:hypothetical protein
MILKSRELIFVIKKIIDIDIWNDIKTKNCVWKEKNNNERKTDNEKTTNDDISNVKLTNMTNLKSFKYANMFINKTFNNLLWKSVIYDFDCSDSLIYDLNRFVNEMTFAHKMIDILRFYVDRKVWNHARHRSHQRKESKNVLRHHRLYIIYWRYLDIRNSS